MSSIDGESEYGLGDFVESEDEFSNSGEEEQPGFSYAAESDSFSTSSGELSDSENAEFSVSESEGSPSPRSRRSKLDSTLDSSFSYFDSPLNKTTQNVLRYLREWRPTGKSLASAQRPASAVSVAAATAESEATGAIDWTNAEPLAAPVVVNKKQHTAQTQTDSGGASAKRRHRSPDQQPPPPQQQQQQQSEGEESRFRVLDRAQFAQLLQNQTARALATAAVLSHRAPAAAVSPEREKENVTDSSPDRRTPRQKREARDDRAVQRNGPDVLRSIYMNPLPEVAVYARDRDRRKAAPRASPRRVPRVSVSHRTVTLTTPKDAAIEASPRWPATVAAHARSGTGSVITPRPHSAAPLPVPRAAHTAGAAVAASAMRPASAAAIHRPAVQHAPAAATATVSTAADALPPRPIWRPSGVAHFHSYHAPDTGTATGTDAAAAAAAAAADNPYKHMTVHEILKQARRDERRWRKRRARERRMGKPEAIAAAVRKAQRTLALSAAGAAAGAAVDAHGNEPRTKRRHRRTQQQPRQPHRGEGSGSDPLTDVDSDYTGAGAPRQIDVFEVLALEAERAHLLGKVPTLFPSHLRGDVKVPSGGLGLLSGAGVYVGTTASPAAAAAAVTRPATGGAAARGPRIDYGL